MAVTVERTTVLFAGWKQLNISLPGPSASLVVHTSTDTLPAAPAPLFLLAKPAALAYKPQQTIPLGVNFTSAFLSGSPAQPLKRILKAFLLVSFLSSEI